MKYLFAKEILRICSVIAVILCLLSLFFPALLGLLVYFIPLSIAVMCHGLACIISNQEEHMFK